MSDKQKSCLGFGFVGLALVFSVGAALLAWAGEYNFKQGAIITIGTFVFFFVIAAYFFLKIENWGLLPLIFTSVYAILPDLILGPEDDIIVVLIGAALTVYLNWRAEKQDQEMLE